MSETATTSAAPPTAAEAHRISIEPAPKDLKPKLVELCRQTFEEHRARQPYAFPENMFELMVRGKIEEAFVGLDGKELEKSETLFIAKVDDVFAGYVHLSRWASEPKMAMPYVSIDNIYVLPDFRNFGVASALVDHVRKMADDAGWDNLGATVWGENTSSHGLFRSCGFEVQSISYRIGPTRQARNYPDLKEPQSPGQLSKAIVLLSAVGLIALLAATGHFR